MPRLWASYFALAVVSGLARHGVSKGKDVFDLEIHQKGSWSPYDPGKGNKDAIVDMKWLDSVVPGSLSGMEEKARRETIKIWRQLKPKTPLNLWGDPEPESEDGEAANAEFEMGVSEQKREKRKRLRRRLEFMRGYISHSVEYEDVSCLHLLETRVGECPKVQPESIRRVEEDNFMERTTDFVLDTILGNGYRPVYLRGVGYGGVGAEQSLEEVYSLLSKDRRPLLVEIAVTVGVGFSLSWVIQAVNGRWRVYQASPTEAFSLEDWIAPESWQLSALEQEEPEVVIPRPATDYEGAKFGFGGGQGLSGGTLIAYRNNLRQLLEGLCVSKPKADFFFSAVALFGVAQGYSHSSNCHFEYSVYEFQPSLCVSNLMAGNSTFAMGVPPFPEYGLARPL